MAKAKKDRSHKVKPHAYTETVNKGGRVVVEKGAAKPKAKPQSEEEE